MKVNPNVGFWGTIIAGICFAVFLCYMSSNQQGKITLIINTNGTLERVISPNAQGFEAVAIGRGAIGCTVGEKIYVASEASVIRPSARTWNNPSITVSNRTKGSISAMVTLTNITVTDYENPQK